jgi:hypothetical protein
VKSRAKPKRKKLQPKPRPKSRRKPEPKPRSRRGPSAQERRLLALARELTLLARGGQPPADALGAALRLVGARGAPSRPPLDKSQRLALAWAREQARLALGELVDGTGGSRKDLSRDSLAWLLLAAGEALAFEPADAAADRVQALLDFVRGVIPRD